MGKLADLYRQKYEKAKASGRRYRFLNHPDLWIMIAYFAEHNLDPTNEDEYKIHLEGLKAEDEELYDMIVSAIEDFMNHAGKYLSIVDTTPDNVSPGIRHFEIYEKR